ncbi:site-specific integrase [Clostridium sp. DSM 100503]|uniref:site-specific integrase n=1 Tax=Clostridium sp. DSM 100503 TaxID=2963282 RepID=UPI00214A42EE|nr:site-specific integrase [Clostridium sp. DSM 100503]MCR1952359.1 site-specific integrase [Clostridium sp. DSM 100503]
MNYTITYRQKDKGWQFIISYKLNGKWKQKSKQGFKTKKEAKPFAEKTLKDLKKQLKNINSIQVESLTFKSLHYNFIEHIKLYKEFNTIKGYKNAYSCFSTLENYEVDNIKNIDIQKCIDNLIKKELKNATIKSYISRISLEFEYYIETYNPIYINPTKKLKLPINKNTTIKKALTKKELDHLLKKLKNNKFYIVAYIASNTGLRCGEILGLTWLDLDEKNLTLSINKQWKLLKNGYYGFGELKSKNSNRTIPVSKEFVKTLKEYKLLTPISFDNRIAPFNNSSIEKYLNPKLKKYSDISIHELRHTYATLLIHNGVDFKTIAKILGHDIKQTLDTYSHVTDDMMNLASKKIEKIFSNNF